MTKTQRVLLISAAHNVAAPGRLLTRASTPEILELQSKGLIESGPYYIAEDRARLLKDAENGVQAAYGLLGASGWWITEKGRAAIARRQDGDHSDVSRGRV